MRGIVMRRRKGVLRREAVLYGNNPTSADVSQLPQLIVVGGKPPANETTAMIVNNTGKRSGSVAWRYYAKCYSFQFDVINVYATFFLSGKYCTVLATYAALRSSIF